jgi:hypothetical protein
MTLLIDEKETLESLAGKTIGSYTVTTDDVENALRPVLTYVTALLDTPEAEFFLESRLTFPAVDSAFGTVDLIVRTGNTISVIDFKFGSGVRVTALSPADDDPDVDVINAQVAFYAAAARHSLPSFFAGVERIILVIAQPQSIEPEAEMISTAEVEHADLDAFISVFRNACEEALSEAPRLKRGAWCRFCAARPLCPLHTAPLLDLAQFTVPAPLKFNGSPPPEKEKYLQLLADGLSLFDAVKEIRTVLHDQAKAALENGDVIPGWALSAGRAERFWRDDENTAIAALKALGLTHEDIVAQTMRSPKQVEIRAKARGLKVPQELIGSNRSGVALKRIENVREPVRGRDEIAQLFSAALVAFQGGRQA